MSVEKNGFPVPAAKIDDAALFEMAHGATANVGFGDLMHLDGAHDAAVDAALLDGVLKGDAVDDGG